ncbi:MAG: hypothetical protein IPM29_09015 [Planctomycetes bacterium]|nr:hypothetical protein [Planctomycetota bacterium]
MNRRTIQLVSVGILASALLASGLAKLAWPVPSGRAIVSGDLGVVLGATEVAAGLACLSRGGRRAAGLFGLLIAIGGLAVAVLLPNARCGCGGDRVEIGRTIHLSILLLIGLSAATLVSTGGRPRVETAPLRSMGPSS